MDLVKRNAEIVALVRARKMPMREIAARYRLSTSSISLIAIRHGVHAQAADPKKVQAASKLIQRGMPLRHVAQTVGLHYQRLRHLLAKQGVYKVPPPNGRPWSERELRVLRRDYGKPGRSLRTIAAKLGRTSQGVNSKAALLGLSWPLEFRASANNAVENAIRPVALGRKNWLFAGSNSGGERAALFYTLIRTATLNGVEPEAYLRDVIARIGSHHPVNRLHELLPWKIAARATPSVAA